jgi:pimeloyl-ACP methyl ester carboxylesterase
MIFRQIGLRGALEAGRIPQVALDWFRSLLRDTDTMRNELDAGPRLVTPLRGLNERILLPATLLATIDVPTYFLWGEDDPMGGADVARPFVAMVPHAELELLPNAGHAVWIDDAEHAAATTRRFLTPSNEG